MDERVEAGASIVNCPYPTCAVPLAEAAWQICACDEKNPLRTCSNCGMTCPGTARFCRACQCPFPVGVAELARHPRASSSTFIFIPGTFYAPPLSHGDFLWALSS